MILLYISILIIGFIFGSFFNVLIYRLPKKESILFPSSHCQNCNNEIKWYDNIPILSYILLRGRCRYCEEKISIQYPIIEFLTGIIFILIIIKGGLTLFSLIYIIYFSSLLIVSVIDFKTKEINLINLIIPFVALLVGLLLYEFTDLNEEILGAPFISLQQALIGSVTGGAFIFLIRFIGSRLVKREVMGEGDIYIAVLIGFALGYKLFFYSMIFAGIFGLAAFLFVPYIRKDKEIPFAPFLSMGLFVVYMLEKVFRILNLL